MSAIPIILATVASIGIVIAWTDWLGVRRRIRQEERAMARDFGDEFRPGAEDAASGRQS